MVIWLSGPGRYPFDDEAALERLRVQRPPENPDAIAAIRWGSVGELNPNKPGTPALYTYTTRYHEPDEDEEEDDETIDWTEKERETTTKRITNPDDAEVYVDVEVIDTITFDRPGEGAIPIKLILDNSGGG
jgi:hypothetical protein